MKSRSESLIRLKKFQVDEKRRQVAQIEMMVRDFERMAGELDQQIEIEQTKTGISDVAHFAYSTFAKAALTRRDNLLNSANDMKGKLEAAEQLKVEQAEYDEIGRLRFSRQ